MSFELRSIFLAAVRQAVNHHAVSDESSPSRGASLAPRKESVVVTLDLGLIVGEAGSAATDKQLSIYVPVRGD